MNRSRRLKQNVAILLAILILFIALWQLRVHPGGMGGSIGTNVFGRETLNILSGSPSGSEEHPAPPTTAEGPISQTNELAPVNTNTPPAETAAPAPPPTTSHPPLSTNAMDTNGPVTVISVEPSDLFVTPPGVTYAANVSEAASIERRLGEASAKGGDIQISLSWNNYNDLDLHCIDPKGVEISFRNTISIATHGELDVDRNARAPFTRTPVENIYWPEGGAPPGLYQVFVVYFAPRNGNAAVRTPFTVRTVVRGWKTSYFKSTIDFDGRQSPKLVCKLLYDPHNPDPDRRFRFVQ